jgi:hypothetical protein
MRCPGDGRLLSGAPLRTTIQAAPRFAGKVKGPVKTAPGSRVMVSPALAEFSAA